MTLVTDAPSGPRNFSVTSGAAGTYALEVLDARDAQGMVLPATSPHGTAEVVFGAPPQVTSSPITSALVGELYAYQIGSTGTQPLVHAVRSGPRGMTVLTESGRMTWLPTVPGTYQVVIEVANAFGSTT